MPQLTLLDAIAASPGCGIQELATGLDLAAPTISVSVRRLENVGLVERRPDPQDGRAVQLYLTERGQGLCQRARVFRQDKMRRLLTGLTAKEGATLVTLLERAVRTAEQDQEKAADELPE
jgi:DNA-binding MarR family transcriptional regulator